MKQAQSIPKLAANIGLHPVKSANVKAVGYSAEYKLLVVQFHSGSKYVYRDVRPEDHKAFVEAKSAGAHFREHILGKFVHAPILPHHEATT